MVSHKPFQHSCLETPGLIIYQRRSKKGDSIPNVEVFEDSPGNKISLAKELASGKGLIIGVPAAFSPGCSDTHIPGYIASDKLKDAGQGLRRVRQRCLCVRVEYENITQSEVQTDPSIA